ncbi:hemolysin III family protein [Microvirga aerilata]|uniref:PAQR family membrane homeostasis protein TrhA n=1 Tax=Microvirga aerilata TaxID=670292 RepID=UPI0028A77EF8|nr:hemolysin III family protein [Microvirga aerilata]
MWRTIVQWDNDKHEILADSIVHALGIVNGLVAVIVLLALAAPTAGAWELTSMAIYGASLMAVLVISALYNLWPVSPIKWILRRFDRSAIYLRIAETYTPFIIQMKNEITAIVLLVGVWAGSLAGMVLKRHRQVVEEGHTDRGSHPDLGDARDTSHLSPDLEGPSTSTAMIRGVGVGRTVEEIGNLIVS